MREARGADGGAEAALPGGPRLRGLARHHARRQRGHHARSCTRWSRRSSLVILVVFIFLQGWRATLIPLLAVPVSLVGTFVLFPLFGFSINTISLLGAGARDRHRGRRRHRGGGGGRAPHRARPLAARRHAEGDVRGVGPGGGDRADPGRRLPADRLHPGHHRPALPAVRRHDRRLGAALGLQRAHALARALRAAAAPAQRERAGRSAPSSAGSTASSAAPPTATCTGAAS